MTFTVPLKLPPELAGLISRDASKEDLGTIVFILKTLTLVYKKELSEDAFERLMKRYSETRTQKREKYLERRKKTLMRLGFPEDEAKDLAEMPKDELKELIEASRVSAYKEQTNQARPLTELQKLMNEYNTTQNQAKKWQLLNRIKELDPERAKELELKEKELETKEIKRIKDAPCPKCGTSDKTILESKGEISCRHCGKVLYKKGANQNESS